MKAVVTGAAGFAGSILTETLRENKIEVYALVRKGSNHNSRLNAVDTGLHVVETELGKLEEVADKIDCKCDWFFHLAWAGGKDFEEQRKNVDYTLDALKAAHKMGCKRFIATGSQAEYGVVPPCEEQKEDRIPTPFTAYGAAKVAACFLSRQLAGELGIEWIWGRIFSLIGKNEPEGRMFPDLCRALKENRTFSLSSCKQNWDYLDAYDAAEALFSLAERGKSGEIYNIAAGDYRPLKEYIEEVKNLVGVGTDVRYGDDPKPFVSLQPSVEKIKRDTGWTAKRKLIDSVRYNI